MRALTPSSITAVHRTSVSSAQKNGLPLLGRWSRLHDGLGITSSCSSPRPTVRPGAPLDHSGDLGASSGWRGFVLQLAAPRRRQHAPDRYPSSAGDGPRAAGSLELPRPRLQRLPVLPLLGGELGVSLLGGHAVRQDPEGPAPARRRSELDTRSNRTRRKSEVPERVGRAADRSLPTRLSGVDLDVLAARRGRGLRTLIALRWARHAQAPSGARARWARCQLFAHAQGRDRSTVPAGLSERARGPNPRVARR